MSSLWLRKLALAGATLAPTSLAGAIWRRQRSAAQKPTQSSTALRATPLKQCVGGSWVASSSTATIDVEDPTTGALIGKVPEGTAADAHAALVAAKEAQPAWAKTAPAARGEALKAMARVIRANRVELAELLAKEQAKVAGLAQVEIDFTAEYFDYYAGWARIYAAGEIISTHDDLRGNHVRAESSRRPPRHRRASARWRPCWSHRRDAGWRARLDAHSLVDFHTGDDPNEHIYLHKIPLGVSVGICPWNFPVFVMARKLAPALVTGNTGGGQVVRGDAPDLRAHRRALDRVRRRRDAAEGHLLRHHGPGLDGRRQLDSSTSPRDSFDGVRHRRRARVLADIVSMTGSVATGKAIMKSAAEHMTKVSLELGGKAPAIVCADADLDLAVKGIVASRICFSGQVCNCCERVYVHESIKDKFIGKLVRRWRPSRLARRRWTSTSAAL